MWSSLLVVSTLAACVAAHGRVIGPPSRSSAWRLGFPTPANYDDDGANCGGYAVQHSSNGGKCGICGDAYNMATPRPHELGGTYGLGLIVAHYQPGSLFTTTVDLTTSHRGFWEFKLCPDPDSNDQACFDKYILATESGETKYYPNQGSTKYNVTYKLPSGLVCDHCVLQWRYTAGNNWGICANGSSGLGCGPQEQFGACSDISIGSSKSLNGAQSADIPAPLMYYLKNSYFDAQQGVLHLLRGTSRPNSIAKNNSVQLSQPSQSRGQPSPNTVQQNQQRSTGLNQQRPIQTNQKLTQNLHTQQNQPFSQLNQPFLQQNQQFSQQNQQLTQSNKQRLTQQRQPHPNQIVSENSRPTQNEQKLNNHQHYVQLKGKPTQSGQNQKLQLQKLIQHQPVLETKYNYSSYQHQQQQTQQTNKNKQQHHQNILQTEQQKPPIISQLDALIQKHRDGQKKLKHNQFQRPNSYAAEKQLPITKTIQITTHSIHSYKVPLTPHVEYGNLKPWKTGKNARNKNKKKHKGKGKQGKRKKTIPYEDYDRIIKVGTW